MGTPSGSKNCNILNDRLDFLASQFERPVYDTSNLEADARDENPNREWQVEKKLKSAELAEFHKAKSGAKLNLKVGKFERMSAKPSAVGPVPEKRKLPGFVKVRSREDGFAASEVDASTDEPEAKQRRAVGTPDPPLVQASVGTSDPPVATPFATPTAAPSASLIASSQGGSGLVAYDSDESDSDD